MCIRILCRSIILWSDAITQHNTTFPFVLNCYTFPSIRMVLFFWVFSSIQRCRGAVVPQRSRGCAIFVRDLLLSSWWFLLPFPYPAPDGCSTGLCFEISGWCFMSLALAQPHSWYPYTHIGLSICLQINSLLWMDKMEFLPNFLYLMPSSSRFFWRGLSTPRWCPNTLLMLLKELVGYHLLWLEKKLFPFVMSMWIDLFAIFWSVRVLCLLIFVAC